MAAKSLKIKFSKFFQLFIEIEFIFMNTKSLSAMTGPPSVLMQPKLNW